MNTRKNRLNELDKIPRLARLDHRLFLNDSGTLIWREEMTRNERRLLKAETKKIALHYDKIFEKLQNSGVGFPVDQTIRSMAIEYTSRYASSGTENQPISFNYFEPFCEIKLIQDSFAPYASLTPETNHLFSASDFFDFLTSDDSTTFELHDLLNLPDSQTFHFTNNGNIDELTFFDASGREYLISGFSLIRRGHSIHWFLVAGEKLTSDEWEILSKKVQNIEIDNITPWKRLFLEYCLKLRGDTVGKPTKLEGTEFSVRTLVAGEFDIVTKTHLGKSIFIETENSYRVYSDDPEVTISLSPDQKKNIIAGAMERLGQADILWNIAESFFQIFQYFETRVTVPKSLVRRQGKLLGLKGKGGKGVKADYVVVEAISVENAAGASIVRRIRMPAYSAETEGHWRRLKLGQQGKDRDGNPINGKTWITKSSPWRNAEKRDGIVYVKDCLAIAKIKVQEIYLEAEKPEIHESPDPESGGELYVLRCTLMEDEVYKVGWTSGTATERARQISSATGVPLSFVVVESWKHDKPEALEVEVHAQLSPYRINNQREFFRLNFDHIRKIILQTISRIEYT